MTDETREGLDALVSRLRGLAEKATTGARAVMCRGYTNSVCVGTQPLADFYRGIDKQPGKALADAELTAACDPSTILRLLEAAGRVSALETALALLLREAVILNRETLKGLDDARVGDPYGWDIERWKRAADAADVARALLQDTSSPQPGKSA